MKKNNDFAILPQAFPYLWMDITNWYPDFHMFINMLKLALGDIVSAQNREEGSAHESVIAATPHVITKEVADSSTTDDPELRVLAEHYGELVSGRVIEVSLQELLAILPRKRRRCDSYKQLVNKANEIGVSLIITSRKKGGASDGQ